MSSTSDGEFYDNSNVTPAPPTATKPYKAVAGFVLTFLSLVVQALTAKADSHSITGMEWLVIVVGSLVTAGTVYGVTNPAKSVR